MNRRGFLATAAATVLARAPAHAFPAAADLEAEARALAARPYAPRDATLPEPFAGLDYDVYRAIRPRPGGGAEIDLGEGILAQVLPRGALHRRPVEIVAPGGSTPFSFSMHDYAFPGGAVFEPPPDPTFTGSGYSGLRVFGPLERAGAANEIAVFQGASYFRGLARGTVHGLSARALALGTGGPGPEEFPAFTRLVLEPATDGTIPLGALVDSPRASAAFFARIRPGAPTVMDCRLVLFPRESLPDAGIAPLTSMFFFGPMGPGFADDFRPAVHDSDVLWIRNGAGETLWRPLANPSRVQVSAFLDDGPRAFGLLQTPRAFAAFEDAEGAYHRRPQAWVEPLGDWGPGAVQLVEIPTRNEYADNIVAFWRPARPLKPGRAHRFAYRLTWSAEPPPSAFPLSPTRSASGIEPLARRGRLFVIDFAGARLPDPAILALEVTVAGGGMIADRALYPLPEAGRLRTSFVFTPAPGAEAAELRATLRDAGGAPVAPVWLWRWTPPRDPATPSPVKASSVPKYPRG
jgi:periplasmic glucans biosynthesis protein